MTPDERAVNAAIQGLLINGFGVDDVRVKCGASYFAHSSSAEKPGMGRAVGQDSGPAGGRGKASA